ncbi:hypothetical protein [Pedobacter jeongneungensis]
MKSNCSAYFNVSRAIRYSPDEESGAAATIPFTNSGWYYYLWSRAIA